MCIRTEEVKKLKRLTQTLKAFIGGLTIVALGILALIAVILICLPLALFARGSVRWDEF